MRTGWNTQIARLMFALALVCAAGWAFKAQCGASWSASEQYRTGCYSDAVPFWGGRGVAVGEIPYLEARMEYPVLTGALIWAEGGMTRVMFGAGTDAAHFLAIVTLVNALLAAVVLWLLWRAGMDLPRLWGWALAPPLVLYVGHNWDMLAVTFAVAALLAARADRLVRASAIAGLGLAAKLYPVLMLPLIGLGAVRGGLRRAAWVTLAAIGAWAAVNLPIAAIARDNWSEFYRFSSERSGTAASIWEIASASWGWSTTVAERNFYAASVFLSGAAAIIAFAWDRHRDRLWLLFTPLLAWFMLTNKVYSPQFDLWLYPMLLMTAPRLRPVAIFTVAGIAAYFAEFWWFAGLEGASPAATPRDIALAAGLRAAAMIWIIVDCVRREPPAWLTRAPYP